MLTNGKKLMYLRRKRSGSLLLARISLAVVLTVPIGTAVAGGEPLNLTKLVELGDPADELGKNLLFADFGGHPQIEAIFGPSEAPVRIDKQGNVSFHAFATEDGGFGECPFIDITQCPSAGVFRIVDNQGYKKGQPPFDQTYFNISWIDKSSMAARFKRRKPKS